LIADAAMTTFSSGPYGKFHRQRQKLPEFFHDQIRPIFAKDKISG
jgi:hypothetical protein